MKERKKSAWRFAFLALAVLGVAMMMPNFWGRAATLFVSNAATIGIIGGADGPTAIFVTGPVWSQYLVPLVLVIVGVVGYWKLRKRTA